MKTLTLIFAALFFFFISGCEEQGNKVVDPVTDYELTVTEETVQGEDDNMREQYDEDEDG